jgi:hypothetical protein
MHAMVRLGLAVLLGSGAFQANADDNIWLGVKAGTLGLGIEATWRPSRYLDFRVGANKFSYDDNGSEAGIDYDTELALQSLYATANLRPPLSPFRFTAGVVSNGNEVNLVSQSSSTFLIGGTTFTSAQVGELQGAADFDSVAPYAGIGFDFRLFDTVGLNFDLGVLWQGTPRVGLVATGPIASDPVFQSELAIEQAELQDAVNDYDLYPVVSLGFSFNF